MFSENLKTMRKEFSQEQLATRLNVVRQTISKWEKGVAKHLMENYYHTVQ